MLKWIFLLIIVLFLDVVLLGFIATTYTGWILMISLVVLTGLIGMFIVRVEGQRTIRKMQHSLTRERLPTNELLDGAFLIVSGVFLLTPGLITDLIGFVLTIPLTRIPIRKVLTRYVITPYVAKNSIRIETNSVWSTEFSRNNTSSDSTESESTDMRMYDLSDDAYTVDSNHEGPSTVGFDECTNHPNSSEDEDTLTKE